MTPDVALFSRNTLLRSWREAICLALIAVLLPLFFVQPFSSGLLSLVSALSNLGHIVFFALLTLLLHERYPLTTLPRCLAAIALVLLLGVIIEAIQARIGRTASIADVLRNLLGAGTVIVWQHSHRPILHLGRFAVSLLIFAELLLVALTAGDRYHSLQRFPVLNTLETAAEMRQWRRLNSELQRSEVAGAEGRYALRVGLSPGDYSGAILSGFSPRWAGFTHLHLDLHNPGDDVLSVALRIHDRQHERGADAWSYEDRFNRSYLLQPGWNQLSVPLAEVMTSPATRLMDLQQIRELRVFVVDSNKPKVIHLDNLRLEAP